jgi:hypothetical protein
MFKPINFPRTKFNFTAEVEDLIKRLLNREPAKRLYFEHDISETNSPSKESFSNLDRGGRDTDDFSDNFSDIGNSSKKRNYSSKSGCKNLKYHEFFKDTDWESVVRREAMPPFIPPSTADITDTRNFDKEFTKLPILEKSDFLTDNIADLRLNSDSKKESVSYLYNYLFLDLSITFLIGRMVALSDFHFHQN